jgi:PAS domain S-box-containing protein
MNMKTNSAKPIGMFFRPISLLIIIITSVFASATLVNLILSVFAPLSLDIKQSLMDAALMVIILFPVMYYLVYEPLTSSIKDLHKSEEALQESEAKFRSLVETTDNSIYVVNRNCEYLFMNAKHRTRLGMVFDEEYMRKVFSDFHSPEETSVFREKVTRVFETGEPLQQELRSMRDGRYFLRTLSPIKGPAKEVRAVSIVSKDITKLIKEGEAERRYHAIFEQSPFGILIIDTNGNIIEFNETARRELGYSREEFASLRLFDINPQSTEEIQDRIKEVLSKGSCEFEVKHKTKYGEIRDVHVNARVLKLFGREVIQTIWQDITERRRTEEALQQYREQLEKLVIERSRNDKEK